MRFNYLVSVSALALVGLMTSGPALAGKRKAPAPTPQTACDKLKPEDRLSEEQHRALESELKARVAMVGGGSASLNTDSGSTVQRAVLQGDHLAQAWGVYQTCVMREAGVIDAATAQEIARSLMGIAAPAPVAPVVEVPKGEAKQKSATPVPTPTTGTATSVGDLLLQLRGANPKADIRIDGTSRGPLGDGLDVELVAGIHSLAAQERGFKPYETRLDVQQPAQSHEIPLLEKKKKGWIVWTVVGSAVAIGGIAGGVAAANAAAYYPPPGGGGGGGTTGTTTTTYCYYYTCR